MFEADPSMFVQPQPSKQPWVSNHTAQSVLNYLHFAYPLILLAFFLVATTLRSIYAAPNDNTTQDADEPTVLGPGGKPLPKKSMINRTVEHGELDFSKPRKLLFEWLSLGAALTFVGNSITVIVHALYAREEEWWCGQAVVVSPKTTTPQVQQTDCSFHI